MILKNQISSRIIVACVIDETNDSLELLLRGSYETSTTPLSCTSSNEKQSYGKCNECMHHHIDLFHNNGHEIIETSN